jgi:two-component system, chemotaxis family, chemotaxis protein CheY
MMMKILIIDEEAINASKLKLVLSKYGTCEITAGSNPGLAAFKNAHDSGEPFNLLCIEMEMKAETGRVTAEKLRVLESGMNMEKSTPLILLLTEEAQKEHAEFLEEHDIHYLIKPYSRKKLETTLSSIGMEKSAPPVESTPTPPPPKPQVRKPAVEVAANVSEAKVKVILKKMISIVNQPNRVTDADFQPMMAELIKNGGKQTLLAVGQFIASSELPITTRIAVIQLAGFIRSPLFLVPLNRIMDTEDSVKLAEAALMAIAKYGDQRALSILNNALTKLKNPMLLNTIRREVAKIKENNPVLAILPRYLQSYKSRKNFRVTLDILKKIVTSEHSNLFVNYLKSGNDIIEDGTFELLCAAGDPAIKSGIFNFFEDRIQKIPCLAEKECQDLYFMVSFLQSYLIQNPDFIDEMIIEMKELFGRIVDIRAKQIILSLLCQSHNPNALNFIKTVYNQEEALKEWVIEKLSGNQQAVDFLFEKYHAGQEVKEQVVKSLLKSEQGLQYFVKHFFTFELDKQELIIQNLTFSEQPFLLDFIREVYRSQLYGLKSYLLHVLRDHFLFEFEDVLFDPDHQREFSFMGNDYMDTICRLFPITTIKFLYNKIAFEDISYTKIKKYLARIRKIAEVEPVIRFNNAKLVNNLFNKVVNANNIELNTLFFQALENIKVLDILSYKYLIESTNTFVNIRGAQINEKEKIALGKFKKKHLEQIAELRDIDGIMKELNTVFANKPINREQLEKLLKTHHTAITLNIDKVIPYLAERLKKPDYINRDERELFYINSPVISKHMENYKPPENPEEPPNKAALLKQFADGFRIIITFKDKSVGALAKDQLREIMPQYQVELNLEANEIKKSDILLCDVPVLKDYIAAKALKWNRIYLYLENRGDYAQFRDYKPKAFMDPLSASRILKLILKELYLED